jgi:hypothetical protein
MTPQITPLRMLARDLAAIGESLDRDRMPSREEVHAAYDRDERRAEAYRAAFQEVWTGAGPFWPTGEWTREAESPQWDNEQWMSVFVALRRACAGIGLTDAERWEIVATALAREASRYAEAVALTEAL